MIARSDAACFVGIDLHKDTLTACTIVAKDREVAYRKISCVAELLMTGRLPMAWAPPGNIQRVRNLT